MVRESLLRSFTPYRSAVLLAIVCLALPELACAQASPFQTGANSLVTNVIAIATPFAVLAIMVLAVVAMTGRLSWAWPIGALVGIGVLFGAPQIVAWVRSLFGV